jgi:HNH endonuclease
MSNPHAALMTLRERLDARSIPIPFCGCLVWEGSTTGGENGYGTISVNNRKRLTHVVSYELDKGPVPKGLELDHLCKVRLCRNTDHLEAVTHLENLLRSDNNMIKRIEPFAAKEREKTHCPQGHPYDEENTYRNPRGRQCKKCMRQHVKEWRARDGEKAGE